MADHVTKNLLGGISLYFHIPFCQKKCHYCDYASFPIDPSYFPFSQYFDLLSRECDTRLARLSHNQKNLRSLYIGGGTPSLVPTRYYGGLLRALSRHFPPEEVAMAENTFEANPESVTIENLKALRSIGFNRISLDIQSLNPLTLEKMGRVHTVNRAFAATAFAKTVFDNVNCDFIVGYDPNPYDTLDPLLRFIRCFQPEHLSIYPLEIHPDTPLGKERADYPEVTSKASYPSRVFPLLQDLLRSEGYRHYEVSSYGRPGFFSRHNLRYWENADYLGIGLSAGGHIQRTRYVNTADWERYLRTTLERGTPEASYLSENGAIEELKETLFMGLRTAEGVDLGRLKSAWSPGDLEDFLRLFFGEEDYVIRNDRLRLTGESFFYNFEALERAMDICDRFFTERPIPGNRELRD